jgi:hypothetical protein
MPLKQISKGEQWLSFRFIIMALWLEDARE